MANTHKCPIDNCTAQLPRHILMCREHWSLVPRDLQQQIYAGWNGGRSSTAYLEARNRAISLVNFKVGKGEKGDL